MIASIQFLRAVAALMVLAYHVVYMADAFGGYQISLNNAGAAGVDVFFVISGFIITYVTRGKRISAGDFLLRRFIRVAPNYWIFTTITVAILLVVPSAFSRLKFDGEHVLLSYLFLLSANNDHAVGTVLGVGWTICYEIYFYVLFAAFLRLPRQFAMAGIASIVIAGAILEHLVIAPPFAMVAFSALPLEFLGGCMLAVLYIRGILLPSRTALLAMLAGAAVIAASGAADVVKDGQDSWRVIYFGIPALLIAAGAISLEWHGLIRFPRLLILIGDASYSLYLSHQFVLAAAGLSWKWMGLQNQLPVIFLLVFASVASVLVAIALYSWMERPITRWLNESRWRMRPVAS